MVRLSGLNIKFNEFSKHQILQVSFVNTTKQRTVRFVSYEGETFGTLSLKRFFIAVKRTLRSMISSSPVILCEQEAHQCTA